MKRMIAAALSAIFVPALFAQEVSSLDLQRRFARGDLAAKAGTLAAAESLPPGQRGPLCAQALLFVTDNVEFLKDDADFAALASASARAAAACSYVQALPALWRAFTTIKDTGVRVSALGALGTLAKGDAQTIDLLNQFLTGQNKLRRSSLPVDVDVVSACADALGALGDSSSYAPLFGAMTTPYPEGVSLRAAESLHRLKGDFKRFLADTIRRGDAGEKAVAFRAGLDYEGFSVSERGEIAETALSASLAGAQGSDSAALAELRYEAVVQLTKLKWSRSAVDGVKNFYTVQTDYGKNAAPKQRFIEAVEFLGALGNSESAQALSLQLGLVNADLERGRPYDADLLLAVIGALGDLGDKVAFDYLLYIGYLPYPEEIKAAAREALNRLTW